MTCKEFFIELMSLNSEISSTTFSFQVCLFYVIFSFPFLVYFNKLDANALTFYGLLLGASNILKGVKSYTEAKKHDKND